MEVIMALDVNDIIPDIKFCFRVGDVKPASGTCPIGGKFIEKSTIDLFSNKRVIIFSLPGAFTPTCSTYQLPGFENHFRHNLRHNIPFNCLSWHKSCTFCLINM